MVTNYTRKDLIDFARFVNEWSKKGMLFQENGEDQITEQLVNNWLITKHVVTHRNNCPNAEYIAQMFMEKAPFITIAPPEWGSYGLTESTPILQEAEKRKVTILYPSMQSGEVKDWDVCIQGDRGKSDLVYDFVKCALNSNSIPHLVTHIPGVIFPIFREEKLICFGLCCHQDDIKPLPMSN